MLNQLAVFLENKKGRMRDACAALAAAEINLRSLMIADTKDFGVLRLMTDDNDKAYKVLKEAGFLVSSSSLIGVEVPDKTGALAEILTTFDEADINIEYLYSSIMKDDCARIWFKTSSAERAIEALKKLDVVVFSSF